MTVPAPRTAGGVGPNPVHRQYVIKTQISDAQVAVARRIVALAGIEIQFATALARKPGQQGPTWSGLTNESIFVGLVLSALNGEGEIIKNVAEILHSRISPEMRLALGVTRPYRTDAEQHNAYMATIRRFHALLGWIDPSLLPKNEVHTEDSLAAASKDLSEQEIAERSDRLFTFANNLLDATWRMVPRRIRRQWKGTLSADATAIRAYSVGYSTKAGIAKKAKKTGTKPRQYKISTDPDAGWYVRSADSRDNQRGAFGRTSVKYLYGYEVTIALTAPDDPEDDFRKFPCIALGMTVHKPSQNPGGHLLRVLNHVRKRTDTAQPEDLAEDSADTDAFAYPTSWLAVDRAYPQALDFTATARVFGYLPVIDYKIDQLGEQGSFEGALLVDGTWYSPSIPTPLINATLDFRNNFITAQVWEMRLKARQHFALPANGNADAEFYQRFACPAATAKPGVLCSLKPDHAPTNRSGLLQVTPPNELTADNKVCRQQTFTIPPSAGGKFWQPLAHESAKWRVTYATLRNSIEGYNGYVKDNGYEALGASDKRRIRGIAAATVFSALALMAANIRKIQKFLDEAAEQSDGTISHRKPFRTRARRRQQDAQDLIDKIEATPPDPPAPDRVPARPPRK